ESVPVLGHSRRVHRDSHLYLARPFLQRSCVRPLCGFGRPDLGDGGAAGGHHPGMHAVRAHTPGAARPKFPSAYDKINLMRSSVLALALTLPLLAVLPT